MTAAAAPAGIDLSIVIPAYNEAERLAPTVARLVDHLGRAGACFEIVVVDDGSTDGTLALARELGARWPDTVTVVGTAPNRGKGHAVRAGMRVARGAVSIMYDADGSTPPEEIPRLVAPIRDRRAAVAIGSRYLPGAAPVGQPLWRRCWSRLVNLIIRRAIVPGIRDTQCGFKAFSAAAARDLFRRATIDGWAFDVELLALARRRGYAIAEVPVAWRDDRRSRVRPLRDLFRVVAEAIAIRRTFVRH
jgi:glycosyltransferase involved in cell wall biosynthesis